LKKLYFYTILLDLTHNKGGKEMKRKMWLSPVMSVIMLGCVSTPNVVEVESVDEDVVEFSDGEVWTLDDPSGPHLTVPYVPTPANVVEQMLKVANVKRGETLYDLGCGDGRIVVTAAKKFGAKGVGVDLDPARIKDSEENIKKNRVEKLVTVRQGDVLDVDVSSADVVTLYLLPSVNLELRETLIRDLKPGARVVSHDFNMGDWQPDQQIEVESEESQRSHTIYLWTVTEETKKRYL
jgi:SAM-dependent methyltransferase